MAVFAVSDLHLPGGEPESKSMTVFGARWHDYIARLERNWRAVVGENDTVIVPGDISWASKLEDALDDLAFIDSLPGKKIIGKGNHDFWWSTLSKMRGFLHDNNIFSIDFLQNNAYSVEDFAICGTRGWFFDKASQADVYTADHEKLTAREAARLELSIKAGLKLSDGDAAALRVFLHFPAVFGSDEASLIVDILEHYRISDVWYGHVHSSAPTPPVLLHKGIRFHLIASDAVNFTPILVR